jgi:hypothetical protein
MSAGIGKPLLVQQVYHIGEPSVWITPWLCMTSDAYFSVAVNILMGELVTPHAPHMRFVLAHRGEYVVWLLTLSAPVLGCAIRKNLQGLSVPECGHTPYWPCLVLHDI